MEVVVVHVTGQLAGEDGGRELVVCQWGLIPWFAPQARLPHSTHNPHSDELPSKATLDAEPALHRAGAAVRQAVLGDGAQRVVAPSPRRRPTLGSGGTVEHLDRSRQGRGARELHHADDQRRPAPPDAPHGQARPEVRVRLSACAPSSDAGAATQHSARLHGGADRPWNFQSRCRSNTDTASASSHLFDSNFAWRPARPWRVSFWRVRNGPHRSPHVRPLHPIDLTTAMEP